MPDLRDDNAVAEQQLADDENMLKTIEDYIGNHIDPYPFVLHLIGKALNAGIQAKPIGEAEYRLLEKLRRRAHSHLIHEDIHSAAFLAKE